MGVKRIRIDFYDDSGCRHTISLEGPVTRDKVGRILDYAELMGALSSPSSLGSKHKYPWTKLDKIRNLLIHKFREATFSSADVRDMYVQFYGETIPLTTVATYLGRLVDRGFLRRSGSQGRRYYCLSDITTVAQTV